MHISDGFADVAGRRIHYRECGSGPAIVLLHTGGASAYEFDAVLPALADGYRAIAWDMPGHGDSDPIERHHRIEDYAGALEGFLQALSLDQAVVAGASIGGYIAMAFSRLYPARVRHAILAEAPLRSPDWYVQNWPMFEAMCAIPTTGFEATAPRFRSLTPEHHERWNIDRNKAGSWTMVDIAWAVRHFDAQRALAGITIPATVLMGATGPTFPEKERWQSLRPDLQVEVMPDCGHFVMIDDPAGFARAVSACCA